MELAIDAPEALAGWLASKGHAAVAAPVPDDLADRLPLTVLRDSGGPRTWPVIDRHRVGVDCYGETSADALAHARECHALLDSLNVTHPDIGGVAHYQTAFGGLPQESTDAAHPDVPMATFLAEVTTRALHVE